VISIEAISTLLILPLFGVFCDVFQFRVLRLCIFEYGSQLKDNILEVFFAYDICYVELLYTVHLGFNKLFLIITVFLDRPNSDVNIHFFYSYF